MSSMVPPSVTHYKLDPTEEWQSEPEAAVHLDIAIFPPTSRDLTSALVLLHDKISDAHDKHVNDAGVIDMYAKIPKVYTPGSDWEDEHGKEADKRSMQLTMKSMIIRKHKHSSSQFTIFQTNNGGQLDKEKGIKEQGSDEDGSEDIDLFYVLEADDNNISVGDDETLAYREQANELKRKVKNKMFGD